ncbi:flagellar biosynthetic protein FliO [Bradyrhizobium lablabi]|uniref:flagellar biosynthetic protein FliO n=1 Tax=Bradyrhizobium lablabi TaxID=722472 RepID=UPI001BAD6C60|nr:flagellar biosynthetic protein FliO [Bradyrhizobium lablabi]MBR0696277.1 flagellar biosynthetic protein FliO [Bradyrhizobium lablabi]
MQALTFVFAFVAVLALIGVAAWLVRRFASNRIGANTNRGRMPRLAVIDAAAVDGRRRLVLVRRDNVEHLLMIGGPSDIVVEPNIVRAMPGRDQMAPRPAVTGEPPPRIAPLPDAAWTDGDGARADIFDQAEPQMPEPPMRPTRPSFADEVRRPAAPPVAERRNDPLTGFTPEAIGSRPDRAEPRPDPLPPRLTRPEPVIPRPPRPSEPPKVPPVRAPERAAAAPPPTPPSPQPPAAPPVPPAASNADANLAEMAQRLEAALRRPAGGGESVAPPVAPEAPPVRPAPVSAPAPAPAAPAAPAPAPQKSGFENLEDEMASLLGRPKTPS